VTAYSRLPIVRRSLPARPTADPNAVSASVPSYPNRFARFLFRAMAVEMGENALNAVLGLALGDLPAYQTYIDQMPANTLDRAFAFSAVAALNSALDTYYEPRIGRGMALRVGRAWFYQGMKGFGALAGIETPAVAKLDPTARCRLALGALAHIFTHFSDQTAAVDESERVFRFVVDPCAPAWGLQSERPVCQMMVGLLQECVRWASGGLDYAVRETQCRAVEGGACIFVVNKQPLAESPTKADAASGEGHDG
jgi:hypothetical protein